MPSIGEATNYFLRNEGIYVINYNNMEHVHCSQRISFYFDLLFICTRIIENNQMSKSEEKWAGKQNAVIASSVQFSTTIISSFLIYWPHASFLSGSHFYLAESSSKWYDIFKEAFTSKTELWYQTTMLHVHKNAWFMTISLVLFGWVQVQSITRYIIKPKIESTNGFLKIIK